MLNKPLSDREALAQIMELSKPGQSLGISEAIDLICEIWNIARVAHNQRCLEKLKD